MYKPSDLETKDLFDIVTAQVDYQVDISSRIIYMNQMISLDLASFIKQRIGMINKVSDNYEDPITIEMNSLGGDLYGSLATIDAIKNSDIKINILGNGAVMSAAALILIAGTGTRMLTNNSVMMLHELSTLLYGTSKDIITESRFIQKIQNMVYAFLGTHTSKSVKYWKRKTKTNFYLTVDECLKHGMIDEIIR